MARSRFRIVGRAARPWLAGLMMLAGLIWWISWLLDTQRIERAADDDEVESAAIASATTSPRVATTGSDAVPVSLADLLPLG